MKGAELSLKFDKRKYEIEMEKQIAENVGGIVSSMVAEAQNGSYQHGAYLLDRLFGKTKQQVDIESGGQPIVFMPTALIAKFGLDKPIDAEKIEEPNVYDVPNEDSVSPL